MALANFLHIFLKICKISGLILLAPILLIIIFYFWGSSGSYPQQKYNEIVNYKLDTDSKSTSNSKSNQNQTYTVVSYNLGYLSGLENAATKDGAKQRSREFYEQNLQDAIAFLAPLQADIMGLQEIDIHSKRSHYVNQVETLASKLKFPTALIGIAWDKNYIPFPYFPPYAHFAKTLAAQSIFSRYPITKGSRIVLEKVASQPFFYRAFYIDRIAQIAEIDLNGQPLILINVHLEAFDEPTRINQTIKIKELAETYAAKYPVLLIGDFNSSLNHKKEIQPSIKLLLASTKLQSALTLEQIQAELFATYPTDKPKYTFDYIFYNRDRIEPIAAQVITSTTTPSDHFPIAMKFRLK